MNNRNMWTSGGVAALGLLLVAVPGPSRTMRTQDEAISARLQHMQERLANLQEKVQAKLFSSQEEISRRAAAFAQEVAPRAKQRAEEALAEIDELPDMAEIENIAVLSSSDDSASWLGVETGEVSADKAKELKLTAERGVLISRVTPDSPAAKAGLKDNDVVTEVNGQRIEGAIQFRRMIHEIPSGRTAQLTVWRDGRTQSMIVTLGKAEERHKSWTKALPSRDFVFQMPEMGEMPSFEWHNDMLAAGRPRLGIDAEDLSGQLGSYFGAPDGEGILVRGVNNGSAAEKAGVKAGDVLIKFNGSRLRTVGDLRERMAEQREQKTIKLGVLRNRSEMSLDVTLEPPATQKAHKLAQRTHI